MSTINDIIVIPRSLAEAFNTPLFEYFMCSRKYRNSLSAICLLVGLYSSTTNAQEPGPINTERPSFSSSPVTLGKSLLQLEAGYQYTVDDGQSDVKDHTLPFALFRYGLGEDMELQLSWSGHTWADVDGQHFDGASDASVGVKLRVNGEDALVPLAVFAGVSLPVGSSLVSTDKVEPTIGAFWSYNNKLDWFGTVLVSERNDETSVDHAIGLGFTLNSGQSAYIEYFGNYGSSSGPRHTLNGGIAFLPLSNLQLDVYAGAGLNDRAADFFLGAGIGYRF